jgi:endoglucanase
LNGCTLSGGYKVAGMQSLVNAVRSTGATQPLMLGGLQWSSDESQWLKHEPTDPDHQLIVSFHNYNFSGCSTTACWNSTIAPLAKVVPVVTGENGENDCAHGYVDTYMAWADAHGLSYLGWAWDATTRGGWTCTGGPSLITNYNGTPTGYGAGLKDHLQALFVAGKLPPPLNEPARPGT